MIVKVFSDDGTTELFNTRVLNVGPVKLWLQYGDAGQAPRIPGISPVPKEVIKSWEIKGSIMSQVGRPLPNRGVHAGNDDVLEAYDAQS